MLLCILNTHVHLHGGALIDSILFQIDVLVDWTVATFCMNQGLGSPARVLQDRYTYSVVVPIKGKSDRFTGTFSLLVKEVFKVFFCFGERMTGSKFTPREISSIFRFLLFSGISSHLIFTVSLPGTPQTRTN